VNSQVVCKSEENLDKFWQHVATRFNTLAGVVCFAALLLCLPEWSLMQETLVVLESDVEPPTVRITALLCRAVCRNMPQYAVCHQCVIKSRSFYHFRCQLEAKKRMLEEAWWQMNGKSWQHASAEFFQRPSALPPASAVQERQ